MSWTEIEEIVLGIKETYSFLSLEELIEAIGIKLKIVPSESSVLNGAPACYLKLREQEIIYLSYDCPREMEAKVLAHELGHAILHDVEMAHYGLLFKSRRIEEEANYFSELLLDDQRRY